MINIKTGKVAGGGVCAALCMVLLFASSFIPAKIALLFAASLVMGICILRYKLAVALITYISVSLLGFFIIPNKLVAFGFVALFGIYPILKLYIEKLQNIVLEYVLKFLVWNIQLVVLYIILAAFEMNAIFDVSYFWLWLAGIVLLLVYDLLFGIFINGFYRTYYKFLD